MSPAMQVKLLRVLQERKVRPVGATEETTVDTRVIAATNRDLASMVSASTFREDLYYRISVIPIELPPLRERAEDISELANHFVQKFCESTGRTLTISENAMRLLERYSWPGNVRELEHTIERAVALERTEFYRARTFARKDLQLQSVSALRKRWSFPRKGSISRPTWTNSKRPTCSKHCVAPGVIKRTPPSFCVSPCVRCGTCSTSTALVV